MKLPIHFIAVASLVFANSSCRMRQANAPADGKLAEVVKPQASLGLITPPDFTPVSTPVAFTPAAMKSCRTTRGPASADSEDFAGWSPANGNLAIEVPVAGGLSFFYNTTSPFQAQVQPFIHNGMVASVNDQYVWQSGFDMELTPIIEMQGPVIITYTLKGQRVRFPDGKITEFLISNGDQASDGSGSYVSKISNDEFRIYHRDEVGSYDIYRRVNYVVQAFSPLIASYSETCVTVPAQTVNKCKTSGASRFLYAGTAQATDSITTVRVVRNAAGRVTEVYNAADKKILDIEYAGTTGLAATLPIKVKTEAEIAANEPARIDLQWNGNSYPLLSKITYKNARNLDYMLTFGYNAPFAGLEGQRGAIASMTTSGDGPQLTTSFELVPSTPTGDIPGGAIAKITSGTYVTKWTYERDDRSPTQVFRAKIDHWVKAPYNLAPNSSESLLLDATTCKVVQYNDAAKDFVRLKRNAADPELVDSIGIHEGNMKTGFGVARRGGTDPIRKFDVMGQFSIKMNGSNMPRLEVAYDVDAVSGLVTAEMPFGLADFATVYEYDDLTAKPPMGTRLVRSAKFVNGVESYWIHRVFDTAAPYRLKSLFVDGIKRQAITYGDYTPNDLPLSVTVRDPANPVVRDVKVKVNEYGDWKEYNSQSGMNFSQLFKPNLQPEESKGYGLSSYQYDPTNPRQLKTVQSNGATLEIENPDYLRLHILSTSGSSWNKKTEAKIERKANGLLDSEEKNGIILFSNPQHESQP